MRKAAVSFILAIIAMLCAFSAPAEQKTTTIMVYMCGSNLESDGGAAYRDIQEMLAANYDAGSVNVIIMAGGAKSWSAQSNIDSKCITILELVQPKRGGLTFRTKEKLEQMNMGESSTLSFFLNYAYENAPADRYALIFWDHGTGPARGVCLDENFDGDSLTLNEIAEALENSFAARQPLEWTGFDACLMSTVETAVKIAPYSRYMIASEESEPGTGWSYSFLNGVETDVDGAETGRRIVDAYFDSVSGSLSGYTMACIDLSRVIELEAAMDAMYMTLAKQLDTSTWTKISSLRIPAVEFGRSIMGSGYDLVDIRSLSDCYKELDPENAALIESAVNSAVVYNRSTIEGSCGLATYHPYYNKTLFMEGFGAAYSALDFCTGYTAYINAYGRILTGEQLVRWNSLGAPSAEYADGAVNISLPLNDIQMENIASARLMVVARNYSDAAHDVYTHIFTTADVALDETGLSADYDYTCVEIFDNALSEPLTGATEYQVRDDGVYDIRLVFVGNDTKVVHGEYIREAGTNRLLLRRYLVLDALEGQYTERGSLDLSEYDTTYFVRSSRPQTDNEYGEHLGYYSWEPDLDIAALLESYYIDRTEFTPVITRLSEGEDLYVMFEITDLQGNIYTTGLTRIYGGMEYPEAAAEITPVSGAPCEINKTEVMVKTADDPGHQYIIVQTVLTNRTERDMQFCLSGFSLNGKAFPEISDEYAIGTGADYSLAPGETRAITLKLSQDILHKLLPDTELYEVSARLMMYEADGQSPVELSDISIKTSVSLEGFCRDADALPSQLQVELAESAGGISTQNQLTLSDDGQLRVSLVGLYVQDESVVLLISAENNTTDTARIYLFDAQIDGASAEIGGRQNFFYEIHNNQLKALNIQEKAWSGEKYAQLELSSGKAGLEYVTVTRTAEPRSLSFRLYAELEGELTCLSDRLTLEFDEDGSVRVTSAAAGEAAPVTVTLTDKFQADTPVYGLNYRDPDGLIITKALYTVLRRVDTDAELASLGVIDSRFYNSGHGWLMRIADGEMRRSDDRKMAAAAYTGVIPVFRYGDTSIPLAIEAHKKSGQSLKLLHNGHAYLFDSSVFAALVYAGCYIDTEINMSTGKAKVSAEYRFTAPDISLSINPCVYLIPQQPTQNELSQLYGTDGIDSMPYTFAQIPIENRNIQVGLDMLTDPENYCVVFIYAASDGKIHYSDPVPLDTFEWKAAQPAGQRTLSRTGQ